MKLNYFMMDDKERHKREKLLDLIQIMISKFGRYIPAIRSYEYKLSSKSRPEIGIARNDSSSSSLLLSPPSSLSSSSSSSFEGVDEKQNKSEPSLDERDTHLSKLERTGIITVLEDTLYQLAIIRHALPRIDNEGLAGSCNEDGGYYIESILQKLYIGLKYGHNYQPLVNVTEREERSRANEKSILHDATMYKRNIENLKMGSQIMKTLKNFVKESEVEYSRDYQNDFEDVELMNKLNLSYVDQWENSRYEQNIIRIEGDLEKLQFKIECLKNEINEENICHRNVKHFLALKIPELISEVDRWIHLYENDLERMDMEIIELQVRRHRQKMEISYLSEEIDYRQAEMDLYLIKREEKRIFVIKNAMARKIQRWWRKIMQERHLGPYRKRWKAKKKKKGDKNIKIGKRKAKK